MNLIKRLSRLFGMRSYMTNLKPCPCCLGRNILFKPLFKLSDLGFFVCDDCGFTVGGYSAEHLIRDWEKLPRPKEDTND